MDKFNKFLVSYLYSILDVTLISLFSIFGSIFFLIGSPILLIISHFKNKQFHSPKNIVITGASGGIGQEFAKQYAFPGRTLYLIDINKDRLNDIAAICQKRGAVVEVGLIDVTDSKQLTKWLEDSDKKTPIDLVIANAGITELMLPNTMTYEQRVVRVNDVNVNGVMNTVLPLIPLFRERRHGQIVLTGSMASLIPAIIPAYSASKHWIYGWGSLLRQELSSYGIGVTVLIPGFVKTDITKDLDIFGKRFFEKHPADSVKVFIKDINQNYAISYDSKLSFYFTKFFNMISTSNLKDGAKVPAFDSYLTACKKVK